MQNPPSDNVFIGDIPANMSKEDVAQIFNHYGVVTSCRTLAPRGDKASCLVRFATVAEAAWVVENLNGNLAEGLSEPIVVRFANAPGTTGAAWRDNAKGGGKGGGDYSRSAPYPGG